MKNAWLYCLPEEEFYFQAFVYHSFTCDDTLEVFVSVNSETDDV